MNDQNKIMQIQYQSSMMKISYVRELQETSLLTKDKRSRIDYVVKMIRRSWDKDRHSLFLKIEIDLRYMISNQYDDWYDTRTRKTGDAGRLHKEIKMSMRYDWFE